MLRDLAVMLADGGDCLADLGALRDQLDLYGNVASDSTAFRVIDSIDEACLGRLRGAVAVARARAWKLGARPQRARQTDSDARPELTVIDIDATLTSAYSDKEQAAGNFKHGFGHHPLLCYLDETGEALAGILRPGNAGSNTAADHKQVLDLALAQLDPQALEGEILVRADGAGATHELTDYCREGQMRFSFGFDLTEPVREAIVAMPETAWIKAIRADGSEREHSQVCEITDHVEALGLAGGLAADRPAHQAPGRRPASFADHDGYRLAVFLTDQPGDDIPSSILITAATRASRTASARARTAAAQPAVPVVCPQPGVAVAGAARPRPDRLDQAAVPGRSGALLGAQAAALPAAAPGRADRPPRPPKDAATRARLAVVRRARGRV